MRRGKILFVHRARVEAIGLSEKALTQFSVFIKLERRHFAIEVIYAIVKEAIIFSPEGIGFFAPLSLLMCIEEHRVKIAGRFGLSDDHWRLHHFSCRKTAHYTVETHVTFCIAHDRTIHRLIQRLGRKVIAVQRVIIQTTCDSFCIPAGG